MYKSIKQKKINIAILMVANCWLQIYGDVELRTINCRGKVILEEAE